MSAPQRVQLTEVGMRDGFQMERRILPTTEKINIGLALIEAGVRRLEATSFVSAQAVPQLQDAADVIAALKDRGACLNALVPNVKGAQRAIAAGVDRITVFVSASETHNQRNVGRSTRESLAQLQSIGQLARQAGVAVAGGVATSFGCPYEGDVPSSRVTEVVSALIDMGSEEITLGDTTGMATPPIVAHLVEDLLSHFPATPLALHFHNTRGLGLVNVQTGLGLGITHFESAIGGLGGCPFAEGATGNVCSEDLVYMLQELGIETGIDLARLIGVARKVQRAFGRELPGQVMKAGPRLAPAQVS